MVESRGMNLKSNQYFYACVVEYGKLSCSSNNCDSTSSFKWS